MGELFELVDVRLLTGPTILCSQHKQEWWIKIMARTAISEAFMSRVNSSPHVIEVKTVEDLSMQNSSLL